jgi:serine/threonine protein kinase
MNDSSAEQSPVELLAEEFLDRQQRGEKPTIREYCERHPELAEEIRDVFEGLALLEDLKPGSQDQSGLDDSITLDGKRLERIGDYRILREIGRGGMGVVYEAEQESLRRRVALKVLPRSAAGDPKAVERFQREARAAARMHHTNIVPVFDVDQDDQHLYYAMQLIQGQGLDLVVEDLNRLRENSVVRSEPEEKPAKRPEPVIAASLLTGRFHQEKLAEGDITASSNPALNQEKETAAFRSGSTSSAMLPGNSDLSTVENNRTAFYRSVAQIGLQTASALSYAHARGIIHRDIKPANLLLDAAGVVWVTDFGLAKTGDSALTHTGDILGTVRYMSPERFRGQCDGRADLYALGLTLYELLVLKPAFAASDRLQLIETIRRAEPATLRSVDRRIPRDLETIILKSIDKEPRRRYQSADELGEDLERFLADRPILARRINVAERFWRWARRNPALAAWSGDDQMHLWKADGTKLGQWQATPSRMDIVALSSMDGKVGKVAWVEKQDQSAPTVVILDTATGERTHLTDSSYAGDVSALAVSHAGDRLLAMHDPYRSGGSRNPFWNIAGATPAVMQDFRTSVAFDAAFTHDGRNLAVAYWNNTIRVYDAKTGELKTLLAGHANSVRCLAYSDDDSILVSGAEDGTVRVWDVHNGELRATLKGHVGDVLAVAMSPDKASIASYAKDQQLRIWRAPSPLLNSASTELIALELVQRDQFKEAVPYFRKLARDAPDDTLKWLEIAPILLLAGDRELYKLHCWQMAAKVKDDSNPLNHEQAVKAALLLEDAVAIIPETSLQRFRAALKKNVGEPGAVPKDANHWLEATSAFAHYRAGQYQQALQVLPSEPGRRLTSSFASSSVPWPDRFGPGKEAPARKHADHFFPIGVDRRDQSWKERVPWEEDRCGNTGFGE